MQKEFIRVLSIVFIFAVASFIITGCSKKSKGKISVGFSQIGAESAWRVAEKVLPTRKY